MITHTVGDHILMRLNKQTWNKCEESNRETNNSFLFCLQLPPQWLWIKTPHTPSLLYQILGPVSEWETPSKLSQTIQKGLPSISLSWALRVSCLGDTTGRWRWVTKSSGSWVWPESLSKGKGRLPPPQGTDSGAWFWGMAISIRLVPRPRSAYLWKLSPGRLECS